LRSVVAVDLAGTRMSAERSCWRELDLTPRQERALQRMFERVLCGAPPFTHAPWVEGDGADTDTGLRTELREAFGDDAST
jgi:hypothetical protein